MLSLVLQSVFSSKSIRNIMFCRSFCWLLMWQNKRQSWNQFVVNESHERVRSWFIAHQNGLKFKFITSYQNNYLNCEPMRWKEKWMTRYWFYLLVFYWNIKKSAHHEGTKNWSCWCRTDDERLVWRGWKYWSNKNFLMMVCCTSLMIDWTFNLTQHLLKTWSWWRLKYKIKCFKVTNTRIHDRLLLGINHIFANICLSCSSMFIISTFRYCTNFRMLKKIFRFSISL